MDHDAQDANYYAGTEIDERWLVYDNFLTDMGRKPTPQHTLERISNEYGYYKENGKWATREEQSRNRGGYNKFTLETANQVRMLYATGKYRQIDLAAMFNTNQAHISQIIRGVAWKGEV